jgi:hypothetical protein
MIGLPYNVFIRKASSKTSWNAPIWKSFADEETAVQELTDLLVHELIDYAEVNGPERTRIFLSDENGIAEVGPC